jgi:hypothetical protein
VASSGPIWAVSAPLLRLPAMPHKSLAIIGVTILAFAGCSSAKPAARASAPTDPPANSTNSSTTTGAGSSSTTQATQATQPGQVATTAPAPTTTAPRTGGSGGPLFVSGPVPAVTGATNLSKEPVVAAGTGAPPAKLTGKELVAGTGTAAGTDATVTVQYVGSLWTDGKVFDASWTDQGPASFQLSGVIPGFKDAIIGMKVGGRREIVIPPALGYGASGQPPTIPPNATLVFVIDLLQVQ